MLFSDSLPQLWLTYAGLSLIVLITGYLGIRLLPLLAKLVAVGVVAGLLWMVAPFSVPMLAPDQTYSGLAPAIVVMAVGVLQHDGGQIGTALPLLLVGAAIGMALGVVGWWLLRRRAESARRDDDRPDGGRRGEARRSDARRSDARDADSTRRGARSATSNSRDRAGGEERDRRREPTMR